MRPVRLEMKGFSTFREHTEVDFADIELMALIGPTGSGKSSVIDAMTFALYGSAARYDEKAVAPVINQLSPEARVRFTFEVAGVVYSATRVVRRTKTGGGTTKEARLERGEALLAGDPKGLSEAVTDLLGLDFQRFNKTVVLPQGRFAEFLHDKPSDRQELLRELFGFGMYERLGRQARDIAGTKRNEASVREQGLADLGDLSDERLADAEAAVAAVAQARARLGEVGVELASADGELADTVRQVDEVKARLDLLGEVHVPVGVGDLSARVASAVDAERAATTARDAARARLTAARAAAADGPDRLACQQLLAAYERHRSLEARAVDAEAKSVAAHERLAQVGAAAEQARAEITAAKQQVVDARRQRDAADEALAEAGDRAQLTAAIALHDRAGELDGQLDERQGAFTEAQASAEQSSALVAEARAEVERLERLAPAAALAQHLHVGEACPVCAQPVERLPEVAAVDGEALAVARSVVQQVQRRSADDERRVHEAAAQVSTLTDELAKVRAGLEGAPDRTDLAMALERVVELTVAADVARRDASLAEAAATEVENDRVRSAAVQAEQAATTEVAAQQALVAQVRADLAASAQQLVDQPTEAVVQADAERAVALADEAAHAQRDEETAEQQHLGCASEREAAQAAEREARHEFDAARERLTALQPPKPVGTLEADWQALTQWCVAQSGEAGARREALIERREEVTRARVAVLHRVEELVEGFVDDPTAPIDDLRTELVAAEADAKGAVKQLEKDRAQHAKVVAQVQALRADAEVADLLGKLLRADRFQRWLLEEAMNDLVERATVRLRELTADQYSLVADDGAFKIVDHRNADEVRDARSLSGGETFLTSLSLALALADSTMDLAAEGAAPMESIFLDEGFGTLDPDTLEVVAGTIEELGASGRMVGIVTHIRDLADRMPTRLEITKGPSGSTVERVDV